MQVIDLINTIEVIFEKNIGNKERGILNKYKELKGVSNAHLNTFEKELSIVFPNDFREYYGIKNGSKDLHLLHIIIQGDSYATFKMLSLGDIRTSRKNIFESIEGAENDYRNIDERIKQEGLNEKKIPFSKNADGSIYLMMDFDPSGKGKDGQIICYVHDPDYLYYIAPTFREVLENTIENLKKIKSTK